MPSQKYRQLEQAMRRRQQVVCAYRGYIREICPTILGHSDGEETLFAFQFGGDSSQGLPPDGEWRCFRVAGISDIALRDGRWRTGSSHSQEQSCVKKVDLDVNPNSPYRPGRRL